MKKVCPCGKLYSGDRCYKCKPKKKSKVQYPSGWKRLSETYRAENPLCEDCLEEDLLTPSEEVHHLISIQDRPDLIMNRSNLRALCKDCHRRTHKG